jgi:hypothetical protein
LVTAHGRQKSYARQIRRKYGLTSLLQTSLAQDGRSCVTFGVETEVICLYGTGLGLDFLESTTPGLSAMDDHEDNYLQMKDVSSERKSHSAGRNKILLGGQGKACLAI